MSSCAKSELENVFCCFSPKKFEMTNIFLLIVFQIQVRMAFDTRSCACGGIVPEFWFIWMVQGCLVTECLG